MWKWKFYKNIFLNSIYCTHFLMKIFILLKVNKHLINDHQASSQYLFPYIKIQVAFILMFFIQQSISFSSLSFRFWRRVHNIREHRDDEFRFSTIVLGRLYVRWIEVQRRWFENSMAVYRWLEEWFEQTGAMQCSISY